jgi:hypothetical protein
MALRSSEGPWRIEGANRGGRLSSGSGEDEGERVEVADLARARVAWYIRLEPWGARRMNVKKNVKKKMKVGREAFARAIHHRRGGFLEIHPQPR